MELAPAPLPALAMASPLCWGAACSGLPDWAALAVEAPMEVVLEPQQQQARCRAPQIMGSSPRGPPRGRAAPQPAPAPGVESWIRGLIETSQEGSFFNPCPVHKDFRKSEATLFCVDCAAPAGGCRAMCQHCAPAHAGHRTIQIRRYVYCNVVRAADISPFVDISGVQTYTINQAKVVFLNHRPQAKLLPPGSAEGCAVCCRALREGCTYCSLACRVESLVQEGRLGPCAAAAVAACCAAAAPLSVELPPPVVLPHAPPLVLSPLSPAPRVAGDDASGAASDSSDCCCTFEAAGSGSGSGGASGARRRRSSASGSGASGDGHHALARRASTGCGPAAAAAAAAWLAKRSSDSSCQSHLDWHSAHGHVCRRKQASPRRSPLL